MLFVICICQSVEKRMFKLMNITVRVDTALISTSVNSTAVGLTVPIMLPLEIITVFFVAVRVFA